MTGFDPTDEEIRRAARPLAARAGIEVDEYIELARLGLRFWRARTLPVPLWRVGIIRWIARRDPSMPTGCGEVVIRCVMGQGLTIRQAIDEARPWATEAMSGNTI